MNTLALNATSQIVVTGLNVYNTITLDRTTAPADLITPIISPAFTEFVKPYRPAPPRISAPLPPPGDVCLRLTLGELLGSGATGRVYSVHVSSMHIQAYHIPPLVVKVARQGRCGHLAREAWFYDELATLQGVSIARCFGWFEAEIDEVDKADIIPWKEEMRKGPSIDSSSSLDAEKELESWGPALASRGHATNVVSVLLLERLSDEHVPANVQLDERFRKEVFDTFDEAGHLGVQIRDIRYANILRAPDTIPGHLPSLPSPFTGATHPWRVIDLERCEKVNFHMKSITGPHHSWLQGLFDALEQGHIFESWMFP